ncbi:MAG: glycosyltransferase family 4 protein [Chloroflexaceae bacterium]
MHPPQARIGFISTRLAGTDGVSLEAAKWAALLNGMGHHCFAFAGECDWPTDHACVVAEAHFNHPDVLAVQRDLFDDYRRSPETSARVHRLKEHLKAHLQTFLNVYRLNLLIAENVLSLPMHVPLGLALAELIAETGIPVIAHHHDFAWERERFNVHAAGDYLRAAFPPTLPSIRHVVINSFAARQMAMRIGERSTLIPNVMDFDTPPAAPARPAAELRAALGVGANEHLLLQPTRIVPRKRIEHAIELVRRLEMPCTLVISHAAGDEGHSYAEYLREYAGLLGVRVIFAAEVINHPSQLTPAGQPVFALADVYRAADLVTYPSAVEGFGNAFLEAIYYRRPLIMRDYEIFQVDIKPKGFRVLVFQDFIPAEVVQATRRLLNDPALQAEIVELNYAIARRYYSYRVLERHLAVLMNACLGT